MTGREAGSRCGLRSGNAQKTERRPCPEQQGEATPALALAPDPVAGHVAESIKQSHKEYQVRTKKTTCHRATWLHIFMGGQVCKERSPLPLWGRRVACESELYQVAV